MMLALLPGMSVIAWIMTHDRECIRLTPQPFPVLPQPQKMQDGDFKDQDPEDEDSAVPGDK